MLCVNRMLLVLNTELVTRPRDICNFLFFVGRGGSWGPVLRFIEKYLSKSMIDD